MPFSLCPNEKEEGPAIHGDGYVTLENTDHFSIWKVIFSFKKCPLTDFGRQLNSLSAF